MTREDNLFRSGLKLSLIAESMIHFSALLIAYSNAGRPLNDEALASIKAKTILGLKNSHTEGLAIDIEADAFRQALDDLEKMVDTAISMGKTIPNKGSAK